MEHLADRILRAFDEDIEKGRDPSFLVVIVTPLKPEFSGGWHGSDELQTIAYLNYATIKRGVNSLFSRLTKPRPNATQSQLLD